MRAPDPAFADPRLARLYDDLDGERDDLDLYLSIAEELAARTVVDIGCGTGSLAVRLAAAGVEVVGVDPAAASLEVARVKPHAERVRWVCGDATALLPADVGSGRPADLVVMTGNVAQVFVDDVDWDATLDAVHDVLRPDGWFVFETRHPDARAWEEWDVAPTTIAVAGVGSVVVARTVTEVALPLVTFEATAIVGGEVVPSSSTLRFRSHDELADDLVRHGFDLVDVGDAPDRPGREMVLLARRTDPTA